MKDVVTALVGQLHIDRLLHDVHVEAHIGISLKQNLTSLGAYHGSFLGNLEDTVGSAIDIEQHFILVHIIAQSFWHGDFRIAIDSGGYNKVGRLGMKQDTSLSTELSRSVQSDITRDVYHGRLGKTHHTKQYEQKQRGDTLFHIYSILSITLFILYLN